MRLSADSIPAGVARISSADFRALTSASSPSRAGAPSKGRGSYSQKVLKSLPDHMRAAQLRDLPTEVPTEHEEQVDLVQWLRLFNIRHYAVANGNLRDPAVAAQLKAEGVCPGISDLIIFPEPGSNLPIVFLEMKRSKGGKLSDPQRDFLGHIDELETVGYQVKSRVACGFQAARQVLMEIGYGK